MPQINGLPLNEGDSLQGLAGTAAVVTYTIFGEDQEGPGVIAQGQLGTGNKVIVPGKVTIFSILLANTSGSAVSGVALSINGASSVAANQFISSLTIPANGMLSISSDGAIRAYDATGNVQSSAAFPFDSTIPAVTTPLALGTAGTALTAAHRDHTHQSPGGIASSVAASAAIVNAEAQVVAATVPANLMQAGTTFRVAFAGRVTTLTGPGNLVFRIRIGTTTLTGNIAATLTAALTASITNQSFYGQFLVTVRTDGASGTVVGQGVIHGTDVTTGAFTALNVVGITATAVALDTTAAKIIELTAVTGAADASVTVQNAAIEIVKL